MHRGTTQRANPAMAEIRIQNQLGPSEWYPAILKYEHLLTSTDAVDAAFAAGKMDAERHLLEIARIDEFSNMFIASQKFIDAQAHIRANRARP